MSLFEIMIGSMVLLRARDRLCFWEVMDWILAPVGGFKDIKETRRRFENVLYCLSFEQEYNLFS
jgi:hypothetical protein